MYCSSDDDVVTEFVVVVLLVDVCSCVSEFCCGVCVVCVWLPLLLCAKADLAPTKVSAPPAISAKERIAHTAIRAFLEEVHCPFLIIEVIVKK
jgi:hypothetical protein